MPTPLPIPPSYRRLRSPAGLFGLALTVIFGGLLAIGCDDGNTTATGADASTDVPVGPASNLTAWSPGAGTTSVPTFNKSCRFGAESVFESPSNGASDDALTLTSDTNSGALSVTVSDGSAAVLVASVTLDRGLVDKSWRNATGTATWSGTTGTVVDGAICFENKLAAGSAARGEFTLVMLAPDGGYHSVSGGFTLAAATVKPADGQTVTAPQLEIDLR